MNKNINHKSYTLTNSAATLLLDSQKSNNYFDFLIHDIDENSQRIKTLDFHVANDTYFGTLATILDIVQQDKRLCRKKHNTLLENLKNDLLYLQENYKIVKK